MRTQSRSAARRGRPRSWWILPGVGIFGLAVVSAQGALEDQKLTASDAAELGRFGGSVAISGDVAIVGGNLGVNDAGVQAGSAYIFRRNGAVWIEEDKLTASDGELADFFGNAVSIFGDVAIVGAPSDEVGGVTLGSAYIFRWDGSDWVEEIRLNASDAGDTDGFGSAVSIWGDVAIVGAQVDDDGGNASGSAYIFRWDGSNWIEEEKLTASDGAGGDRFGVSVSLSAGSAIVGAYADDDAASGSGSAYIFRRNGGAWIEEVKLTASDPSTFARFGESVAMSGDVAIVGAVGGENGAGVPTGSAYVFRRNGSGWVEEGKLVASDSAQADQFGISVGISGSMAIVGADRDDDAGNASGSAYVFRWNGVAWVEADKLTSSDADEIDLFGFSTAISGDVALVGAWNNRDEGSQTGSAYIFNLELAEQPIASLDIRPATCPNDLNLVSKGYLPAAIAGSDAFDVADIDVATLTLSRADGAPGSIAPHMGPPGPGISYGDVTAPFDSADCACDNSGGDGVTDLLVKFSVVELVSAIDMSDVSEGDSVEFMLSGALLDGTPFELHDCALIVRAADLDFDGAVDGADLSVLLANWGSVDRIADIDGNGLVDGVDLAMLLGDWGWAAR